MLFPPAQSSIWRYGAKPRKRTRSLKFVRQKEQRRGNVSDWYHASKHWLFATFASLFSSLRASCSSLPSFASRRRLLGLRRRSFRTRGCRSGVDLDDLGAKKDYEEMLAKKWRLCTDEEALVLQTQRAGQLSRAKTCAGWAPQWPHSHAQSARCINFGSFAKACHGKSFYSGFLFFPGAATGTQVLQFDKKIRSVPHFLQPPAIDKEPESNAKMYVNQRRDEMARTWKHILRHDHFRAKYRYVGVFFERRFQPLSVGGFFSNQRELISRCPKSPFPSKTQNRQIARTSPLKLIASVR